MYPFCRLVELLSPQIATSQITNPQITNKDYLKVLKREIFDRSDFPDFYTIKSLHVGDFRVKMKKNFRNI